MRTRSRRQLGWAAAGALAVAVGAPTLAHAQQSGLFPLAPIRRERPPCAAEDPVYRLYRHEYFGYHPTCWRKFPAGWGCPSPEAPDAAKSFQEIPRDVPPADNGMDNTAPEGEMNPPEGPANPPPATGPGQPNPSVLPPLPPGNRNPFELDNPPAVIPPARGDANPSPATDNPGAGASAGASGLPPVVESEPSPPAPGAASETEQPLITLPDPVSAPAFNPSVSTPATAAPVPGSPIPPPPGAVRFDPNTAGPFQAPRRTSMLGNLFSGRIFRR